jgi:PhnB protein
MQITPYIIFSGNCEEALEFYEKAIGGQIKDLMRFEGSPAENMSSDKQKVMHSHFVVDGNLLFMASDNGTGGSEGANGGLVHLSLNFTDAGRIQQVFAALSDGGRVTMPLQDTFWGATFGMLTDQFGVNWMFNYDKPGAKQ